MPLMGVDKKPLTKEESAKVPEAAIRKAAKKPMSELAKADYEKVAELKLWNVKSPTRVLVNGNEFVTSIRPINFNH